MARISLENLSKRFGDDVVLDGTNLEIEDGEFFVFVGPSGCGKSTLLRLIAGLISPTTGEIGFDGKSVTAIETRRRNVAMVFQNYALYPHKNVYDNVAFGLRARKMNEDEIDKRVNEIAGVLDIARHLGRWPKELSGGERQRVAIGRAVVRDPTVYLLDEPLSNLDAQLRIEMRGELARIHQRVNATFVYVTHDQVEAMTLGQRIAVMRKGKLEQVDTPENLYEYPTNQFVAGFIGSPPMNIVEGTFAVRDGGKTLGISNGDDFLSLGRRDPGEFGLEDGDTVRMGVRPESISVHSDSGGALEIEISRIEPIGHEGFVYFDLFGTEVTARVNRWQELRKSKRARIDVGPNDIYLFSPEDETCLWAKGRRAR
jgi:multiple sugar transport system ATP-binding protein